MVHILILYGISHGSFIRWSTSVKFNQALVLRLEGSKISRKDIKSTFSLEEEAISFTILQLVLFCSSELLTPHFISVENVFRVFAGSF